MGGGTRSGTPEVVSRDFNKLIQIFNSVTKALFTPGPTTLWDPFRGLPGWRRTSWRAQRMRLEALNPTVIFNRECGAKRPAEKPPHFF